MGVKPTELQGMRSLGFTSRLKILERYTHDSQTRAVAFSFLSVAAVTAVVAPARQDWAALKPSITQARTWWQPPTHPGPGASHPNSHHFFFFPKEISSQALKIKQELKACLAE